MAGQTWYGPADVTDPTQWHTWRLVFATRNNCVYLDAWTVDGVDVLTSSRSYCSAFGTTTYLGFMAYSNTYAYVRGFSTTSSFEVNENQWLQMGSSVHTFCATHHATGCDGIPTIAVSNPWWGTGSSKQTFQFDKVMCVEDVWDQSFWSAEQSGITSEDKCECALSRTGTNCEQETCAPTTAAAST